MRPGDAAWPRWEEFVRRLERWSPRGGYEFGSGGRCIGHTPWDGPHAYLHTIFVPLSEAEVAQLEAEVSLRLSPQIKNFYLNTNGADLFGIISVRGLVGLVDRRMKDGIRQPISVRYGSVDERPKGLATDDFVFGGEIGETIVGQLVIARTGDVRIVHPIDGTNVTDRWPSFDDFIFSEFDRLGLAHNAAGEFVGEKDERLPPLARKWDRK
jgi:hypothetical protein